jgi:hypothetical protein
MTFTGGTTIEYGSSLPDSATFTFADGSTQTCHYHVGVAGGTATAGATLDGYMTDASGMVTTGVWKRHSTPNQHFLMPDGNFRVFQQMDLPSDFVVVGGGAVGVPDAAFIYQSYPTNSGTGSWFVGTESNLNPVDHDNDAYAIGLTVEGLPNLQSLVQHFIANSGFLPPPARGSLEVAHPSVTVALPSGFLALGGGAQGYNPNATTAGGLGQYLTASAPEAPAQSVHCYFRGPCTGLLGDVSGWTASSKDHWVSAPGWVYAFAVGLPVDVNINNAPFHFEALQTFGSSVLASQPGVVVAGSPGEYALTGIGAFVHWDQGPGSLGNLLWKLQPRADIAGADVASTDHGGASPATIDGFAIGIKLVPGHS